jgi:hypothetical protein
MGRHDVPYTAKVKIFPFIHHRLRRAEVLISMRELAFLIRVCKCIHCDDSADGNSSGDGDNGSRDGNNTSGDRNNISGDGDNINGDRDNTSRDGNSGSRCGGHLGCMLMRCHVGKSSNADITIYLPVFISLHQGRPCKMPID